MSSIKALFAIFVLCSLSLTSEAMKYNDCGSVYSKVHSVKVSPCHEEPCKIYKGQNSTITIKFLPSQDTTDGHFEAYSYMQQLPIPFKFSDDSLCPHVIKGCPIKEDHEHTFRYEMQVPTDYPMGGETWVSWMLVDKDGNNFVCVKFMADIKHPDDVIF